MNGYEYSKQELEQNKVLKYNRDVSQKAIESAKSTNQLADTSIESSVSMLGELGITIPKCPISPPIRIEQKLTLEKWDNIANEASQHILEDITLEDLLTKEDIDKCWEELDEISAEFSRKTSIVNKTDLGLPVPILSTFNESFASELYKSQYDALCFARDAKIVGTSSMVSLIIDIIITLTHSLFRPDNIEQNVYAARTRKILLVSNSIASTSTIINAAITSNPQNLDIGSLFSTVAHLFLDIRFITELKHEFIAHEVDRRLQEEINEIDKLYSAI